MCDPRTVCAELGGVMTDDDSCVYGQRKRTAIQPCRAAVANKVAFDEYGPCYSFMELEEGGGVRERYRFTSACASRYDAFAEMAGMCATAREWSNSNGTDVPPLPPADVCALNSSSDRCAAAPGCAWNGRPRELDCGEWPGADGSTETMSREACGTMCAALGGTVADGKCRLASCLSATYS